MRPPSRSVGALGQNLDAAFSPEQARSVLDTEPLQELTWYLEAASGVNADELLVGNSGLFDTSGVARQPDVGGSQARGKP